MIEDDEKLLPEEDVEKTAAGNAGAGPIDPQGPLGAIDLNTPLSGEQHQAFDELQNKVFSVFKNALSDRGLSNPQAQLVFSGEHRPAAIYLTWALINQALIKPDAYAYLDSGSDVYNEDSDGLFWGAMQETFETMMQMGPIA